MTAESIVTIFLMLKDFDNLLIKACELLRKENRILSNVQAVLVDEVGFKIVLLPFYKSVLVTFLVSRHKHRPVQSD